MNGFTDLVFLFQYIDTVILGICLIAGFVLKEAFSWFQNKYIPLAMTGLGAILAVITNVPNINLVILLGGMISGLASTGLYEMLRNLLNKDGKKDEKESE